MTVAEIPLKPFPKGKIADKFGGPAQSALEVLERTRVTLSPRGAWSSSGWTVKTNEGHGRCVLQCFNDVDGIYVHRAKDIFLLAVKETTGKSYSTVESFNDATNIHKHHVIAALDRAIELAQQ